MLTGRRKGKGNREALLLSQEGDRKPFPLTISELKPGRAC